MSRGRRSRLAGDASATLRWADAFVRPACPSYTAIRGAVPERRSGLRGGRGVPCRPARSLGALQEAGEELPRQLLARIVDDLVRRPDLDEAPFLHEVHAI